MMLFVFGAAVYLSASLFFRSLLFAAPQVTVTYLL